MCRNTATVIEKALIQLDPRNLKRCTVFDLQEVEIRGNGRLLKAQIAAAFHLVVQAANGSQILSRGALVHRYFLQCTIVRRLQQTTFKGL